MYDSILVPTDGSDHALRAATHVQSIADTFDASVHVLSVVDVQAAAGPFSAGGIPNEYVTQMEDNAEAMLETVTAVLSDDTPVTTVCEKGRPAETIIDYVEAEDIEMVAMGTHGRTGVNRFIMGSVTENVLRQSPVPLLTVRATEESPTRYDDILLPTDGSNAADAAIDHAITFASAYDATLHVVYVADVSSLSGGPGVTFPEQMLQTLHRVGHNAVDEIVERATDAGIDATGAVRDGYPASDLIDYAENNDVDLITMGTTGQTGLSRFLLGSTTERVIRHAETPVLAINARDRSS